VSTQAKREVLEAMKAVFEKYGDAQCFSALVEAIECSASAAANVATESCVFQASHYVAEAKRFLDEVRVVDPSFPSVADSFEVTLDIRAEMSREETF
jgi:hypothetical protein